MEGPGEQYVALEIKPAMQSKHPPFTLSPALYLLSCYQTENGDDTIIARAAKGC